MAPADAGIGVEVCYSPAPGATVCRALRLPAGSTLWQAVLASGLLLQHPELGPHTPAGIWGRRQPPDTPLRERDRVELYRALQVDPKEARRLRYRRQRA